MNRQTYRTKINLQYSGDIKSSGDEIAAGYLRSIPSGIYYKDSFEWVTEIEEYTGKDADFTGATCKLYCCVGAAKTEIGTGTVGTETNQITWQVPPNSIPAAAVNTSIYLYAEIISAGAELTSFYQSIQFVDLTDSTASTSTTIHNNLSGIDGGAEDEYYHLTEAEYSRLQSSELTEPAQAVTLNKVYYRTGETWTLADCDIADLVNRELFLSLGTNVTDGMITAGEVTNISWAFSTIGAPVWLGDDGEITETEPTETTHAGRVARPCGFIRSATSIYFNGHILGAAFTEASV